VPPDDVNTTSQNDSLTHRSALLGTLAIVVTAGWVIPLLRFGFWLDETGTYYLVSSTWSEFIPRMSHVIQSPLHSVLLWLVFHAGFTSEIALRLPGMVAMLGAALFVYLITVRLTDKHTALLAAVLFAAMPKIQVQAGFARPYGFAIAFGLGAFWAYWRWIESPSLRNILLCIAFLTLAFYTHVLFVTAAVVLAVYSGWRMIHIRDLRTRHLMVGAVVYLALCIPILPYYLNAARNAREFAFLHPPGVADVLQISELGLVAGALVLTVGAALFLLRKPRFAPAAVKDGALAFLAAWCLAPIGFLYIYSRFGPASVILDRYLLILYAGNAVGIAFLVRCFASARVQVAITCVTALLLVGGVYGKAPWAKPLREDWRAVLTSVKKTIPSPNSVLLFNSGFIEAQTLTRHEKPDTLGFILAPLAAYPVPARIVSMPNTPAEQTSPFMERRLNAVMETEREFFFVGNPSWFSWLLERTGRRQYEATLVAESRWLLAYRFSKKE
jgi:mannosyltransferase